MPITLMSFNTQHCQNYISKKIEFEKFAEEIRIVLANISEEKCILMGDFNITPDDPLLVPISSRMYDTANCFTRELLSFPSDKPEIKIDYIFTSRDIKVLSADIPADVVSDHRPYIAVIAGENERDI